MAILVEYNKDWSKLYKEQAKLIKKTIGKSCVATQHIGSTAIPDAPARPVIDILLLLKNTETAQQLAALGYSDNGDGTYLLQGDTVSYLVYCADLNDHDTIDTHMGLLNHLRTSKKSIQDWSEQKQAWAEQFANDAQGYESAKKAYFEQIAPGARDKQRHDQKLGSSLAIGMCLGCGVGMCFGVAMNNIGVGMCIGMSVGMCLGLALGHANDKTDKKQ